jgi:hypothetical protein
MRLFTNWMGLFSGRMLNISSRLYITPNKKKTYIQEIKRFMGSIQLTPTVNKLYLNKFDLSNLNLEEILQLQKQCQNEKNEYGNKFMLDSKDKEKFLCVDKYLNHHLELLENPYYFKKQSFVQFQKNKKINGFDVHSFGATVENIFNYRYFKELLLLMTTPDQMLNYNDWKKKMRASTCSDWNKQDEHGNSYGGYWEAPKESYEYKNAWDLTFKRNCQRMWNLPFSHAILLKTIEMGCKTRQESVRYSNFVCVWILKKLKLTERVKQKMYNSIYAALDKHNTNGDVKNFTNLIFKSIVPKEDFKNISFPKPRKKVKVLKFLLPKPKQQNKN